MFCRARFIFRRTLRRGTCSQLAADNTLPQ